MKKKYINLLTYYCNVIMFRMFDIAEKREKQLDKEELVDEIIKKNIEKCPKEISEYLLVLRNCNRKQFKEISNTSIFSKYECAEKNIDDLNKIYDNILSDENLCDKLPYLNSLNS